MEELRQNAEPDIVIVLVGNKIDLVERDPSVRAVFAQNAKEFADQNGLHFFESSAVTNFNVKNIFENLLQEIYKQKTKVASTHEPQSSGVQLRAPGQPQKQDCASQC